MSDKTEPLSVTNLRRIWNKKRAEMQITQAEAAKQLGWTQGAFSQYLNNLTSLNAAAIIKLANFLGVDPQEIDPDINDYLPNLAKFPVRYAASNPEERIKDQYTYIDTSPKYFMVVVDEEIKGAPAVPHGALAMCHELKANETVTRTTHIPERFFFIRRKNDEKLEFVSEFNLPPSKQLKTKWLIHGFTIY